MELKNLVVNRDNSEKALVIAVLASKWNFGTDTKPKKIIATGKQ